MIEEIKDGLGKLDLEYSKWVLSTIEFWHNAGFTPNMLTTLGVISTAAGVYFLYKKQTVLASICILLWMYFDYADGILARKYSQVTEFGDYYDHVTDWLGMGGILSVLAIHGAYIQVGLLLLLTVFFVIHMGCIEIETENKREIPYNETPSLGLIKSMCFAPDVMKLFDGVTLYGAIVTILLLSKL